jgi:hypothetical protein
MAKTTLDPDLLKKIVETSRKETQYVREQVSKRASRLAISSAAAQILWAKELGIGTAHALRRAPDPVKNEVRDELRSGAESPPLAKPRASLRRATRPRAKQLDRGTVGYVLQDEELRARCVDLIVAPKHHDRALREATTVLEDRVKKLSGINGMTAVPLFGKALNPDPTKAVLVVSDEKEEQAGIYHICLGVMETFRNKTHHNLSNSFTQVDAMKFCGFVDTLLAVIAIAKVYSVRI